MPKTKKVIKTSRRGLLSKIVSSKRLSALVVMAVFAVIGGVYILISQAASVKTLPIVGLASNWSTSSNGQYRYVGLDGAVYDFGGAKYHGGANGKFKLSLDEHAVAIGSDKTIDDYYILTNRGRVIASDNTKSYGDLLTAKVSTYSSSIGTAVGITVTPSGKGYYIATSRGKVVAFGDASVKSGGLKPGVASNIVGIARTSTNNGYWLVGKDGGVFSFGDAKFYGSLPQKKIKVNNIVGMVRAKSSLGYYLVGSDGGVFALGSKFYGSAFNKSKYPVVGMDVAPDGNGYWLAAQDGGIFTFGSAKFSGNTASSYAAPSCSTIDSKYIGTYPHCLHKTCQNSPTSPGATLGTWPNCTKPVPPPTKKSSGNTGSTITKGGGVAASGISPSCKRVLGEYDELNIGISSLNSQWKAVYEATKAAGQTADQGMVHLAYALQDERDRATDFLYKIFFAIKVNSSYGCDANITNEILRSVDYWFSAGEVSVREGKYYLQRWSDALLDITRRKNCKIHGC